MRRATFYGAVGLLALAVAWTFWHKPVAIPRHRVTATVLSVTNDAARLRHATIQVANEGDTPTAILAVYGMQNRGGLWRTNQAPKNAVFQSTNLMGVLPFHPRATNLAVGESCNVTLALPFDDLGWRVLFWCVEPQRPPDGFVDRWSRKFGLATPDEPQTIAYTDWTE